MTRTVLHTKVVHLAEADASHRRPSHAGTTSPKYAGRQGGALASGRLFPSSLPQLRR